MEGYFDLISLHVSDVRNSVATLGTSVTEEQVSRLRNHTENITLVMDGDAAGVKSALRLVTLFGEMGINGKMVVLPDGLDPDSLIRRDGAAGFREAMQDKSPLLDHFFAFHAKRHGLFHPRGEARFHTDRSSLSGSDERYRKEEALHPASIGADRGGGVQVLGQHERTVQTERKP